MKDKNFKATIRHLEKGNTYLINLSSKFIKQHNLLNAKELFFYENNNNIYLSLTKPNVKKFHSRKIQSFPNSYCKRVPFPIQFRKKYVIAGNQTINLIEQDEETYLCEFKFPIVLRSEFMERNSEIILKEISHIQNYLEQVKNNFVNKGD